jgi:iron complex transport system substrate-binding protein
MSAVRRPHVLRAALLAAILGWSAPEPLEGACRRLVTLAPSLTELAFALDLGDRVVGVSAYSRWPAAATRLPRLGGLFDPRVEAIVALRPDLALLLPSQEELGRQLRGLGIDFLVLPSESLGDIEAAAAALGRRCGVPESAAAFVGSWQRQLAPVRRPAEPPRVLLVIGRTPGTLSQIVVAGPGTFFDELLERLGAVNAFADAPLPYPQASLEAILARDPTHILELQGERPEPGLEELLQRDWQRLARLTAVQRRQVRMIAGDHVLLPGPRLPELYRQLSETLAP